MPSSFIKFLLALAPVLVWYTFSRTFAINSYVKPSTMTTFTEPQNPKLGVYASPEEWRERLDSLPDRQALGGKIPSFYCESWLAVAYDKRLY
jgi:hypothetical protein